MIPILPALVKVERNLKGGQSRPWIVTVQNNNRLEEYVIKLFNKRPLQGNLMNKELFASVIAREFEIPTSDPALITLSDDFIHTLSGEDKQRVEYLNPKIVFGCKFQPTYSDYPIAINPSSVKFINPETIFAFDVLIRNFDRRKKKPNLIIDGNNYFCIDHEHSLDIIKPFSQYDIFYDWTALKNPESYHLFFEYLRRKKDVDFFEFSELLKSFNTKSLEKVGKFLSNQDLDTEELETTLYYFEDLIQNKHKFFQLLNLLLS